MKALILLALFFGATASGAAIDTKTYTLQYELDGRIFIFKSKDRDYLKAIREGGQACWDYYTKDVAEMSEERGLDIIDVCANPR